MPDVDVRLRSEARTFYNEVATPPEQRAIDDILSIICANPHVDDAVRFATAHGDTLYNDGVYWVLYSALNNWTIEIIGIGTVNDDTTP